MSDKLQDVKVNLALAKVNMNEGNTMLVATARQKLREEDASWLIEQLEQSQQEVKRLKEAEHVQAYWYREGLIKHLREQNQKLIEALEGYADRNNHNVRIEYSGDANEEEFFSDIEVKYASDFGQNARDILQEVQQGTSKD